MSTNVRNVSDIDWLYRLRPVSFNFVNDPSRTSYYGLTAREVAQVAPTFVKNNSAGEPESVSYTALITPLLKAIQDQKKMIEQLQKEVEMLKSH